MLGQLARVTSSRLSGETFLMSSPKHNAAATTTVLGHEFAGTIADANGPLPQGLEFGSQVAVCPMMTCGTRATCPKGHENICMNR